MKYFTKEFCRVQQILGNPFELKIDERTQEFSEELLNELYDDFKKDVCVHIPPDSEYYDSLPKRMYESNMVYIERYIPKAILSKVSDIRLLATQHCTQEVYNDITAFFDNYRAICNKAEQGYREEYQRNFSGKPPYFKRYSLHDCKVVSFEWNGNDFIMNLDNSGGLTDRDFVIFKNAKILEKEDDIEGAWWVYDELYKTENGYEFHGLTERYQNSEMKCSYFTVACEYIKMHKRKKLKRYKFFKELA